MNTITTKFWTLLVLIAFSFTSCQAIKNSNNSQKGAVLGVLSGAALGAIVGGKDNSALGAIIGAAVGGGAGAIIGKKMDKQAEDIQTTLPGATVKRTQEGIQVILDEKSGDGIKFDTGSALVTPAAKETLSKLVTVFREYPDTNLLVVGHTDSSGSDELNMELSKKRSASVTSYLTSAGISKSRLFSEGRGESEPKVSNSTKEGMASNRRVEIIITANEKAVEDAKLQAGE